MYPPPNNGRAFGRTFPGTFGRTFQNILEHSVGPPNVPGKFGQVTYNDVIITPCDVRNNVTTLSRTSQRERWYMGSKELLFFLLIFVVPPSQVGSCAVPVARARQRRNKPAFISRKYTQLSKETAVGRFTYHTSLFFSTMMMN